MALAGMTNGWWSIQARTGALAAALTLVPTAAFAQTDEMGWTQRLIEIRELSRFVPDKALAELRVLQPQVADKSPATRAELLAQMSASRMRMGDNAEATSLAQQVIDDGTRLNDDVVTAKGKLAMAYALFAQADIDGAHRMAFEAEKLAMRTDNAGLRTHATITAGQSHSEQGNFPQALTTLQRALDLSRTIRDDPAMHVAALNALTVLYTQMKEYDKADEMLAELLAETEKLDSPGRMALAKTAEYGLAIDAGQHERALRALLRSLDLERKLGAKRMIGETLVNLSDIYLKRRDYPRALQYGLEALRLAQFNGDDSTVATARINLGQAYLALGRIAEGKRQFEAGLLRYEQENNKPDLQVVLHEYGVALERAGDLAGAVAAYHRERDLSNELFEKQRQQTVLELQEKYENEKKERQIELLSRENQLKGAEIDNRRLQQRLWWLLALAFGLAAAAIGMLYRKVRNANAQLEQKNLALKAQSSLDPLTALYNRRHFQEFMRGLQPAAKPDKADMERRVEHRNDVVGALFLLDVDHFKHINDTYGHAGGDAVLKMIAENLRVALRETDMIVRWGGEEFLAFLPANPRHGLDDIARRILSGIASQTIRYQNHNISVNVSVGYAPFPLAPGGTPLAWERTVNLVDMALYLAKSHGRNRAYGVNGFTNFEHTSMEAIEQDLERAWRAGFVDLSVVLGDAPVQAAA
jgi:diguanylate cyclase (GGDEF)-like protein